VRFLLLDQVTDLQPGRSIEARKALSLAEEYLADHFPAFPVLPGVLMIEAIVQTAAMLVHVSQHFAHSMVVLAEARNVKFKSFIKPGNIMRLEAHAKSIEPDHSSFLGTAFVDDTEMVSARIKLRHFNLADENPGMNALDEEIIATLKDRARLLGALP